MDPIVKDRANDSGLENLDRARAALAEARTLGEVKKIRDVAEAARTYAKAAHKTREILNYAGEIKLLAERKAGEILTGLERGKTGPKLAASLAGNSDYRRTLQETGTPERTARFWQRIAKIPEITVKRFIAAVRKTDDGEITTAGLLRFIDSMLRRSRKEEVSEEELDGIHEMLAIRKPAIASRGTVYVNGVKVQKEVHEAAQQIIKSGFQTLAKARHPDHGGSAQDMQVLNAARQFMVSQTQVEKRRGLDFADLIRQQPDLANEMRRQASVITSALRIKQIRAYAEKMFCDVPPESREQTIRGEMGTVTEQLIAQLCRRDVA